MTAHSPRRNALIRLSARRRLILAARTARSRADKPFSFLSTTSPTRAVGATARPKTLPGLRLT